MGILGMKTRALAFQGNVSFASHPGGGTLVVARFPNPLDLSPEESRS